MQHSRTLLRAQFLYILGRFAVALAIVAAAVLVTASAASAIPGDGGGGGGTTVEVNISAPVANSVHTNAPGLSFTKSTGTVATCLVDGDFDNATEFCVSGWTPPYQLGEGTHTYSVAIESADGSSTDSDSRSFVIDRTAPGIVLNKPNAPVSGDPTIGIAVTDANPNQINCSLNGGLFLPCGSSATTGSFSTSFADGSNELAVEAVDKAGNATLAYAQFTVDKSAPQVNVTTGWGDQTDDSTPTFEFAVNDLTSTSATCEVVGVTAAAACTSPHTVAALPDGAYTLKISAVDAAGNSGSAQFPFTVDAPEPTDPTGPTGPTDPAGPTGPAGGPGQDAGGGSGIGGPAPAAAVTLTSKSGKAKGGRVPVTVTVIVRPPAGATACGGSVKIVVTPGKGKAVARGANLKVAGGACVAKATIKVAKKLKSKKATVTAAYAGSEQVAPFSVSKSLRRL